MWCQLGRHGQEVQAFLQAAADQGTADIVCPLAHSGVHVSSGTLWEEGSKKVGQQVYESKCVHLRLGRESLHPRGLQSDPHFVFNLFLLFIPSVKQCLFSVLA